jgi:methyltransferase (TIGR00027 family)
MINTRLVRLKPAPTITLLTALSLFVPPLAAPEPGLPSKTAVWAAAARAVGAKNPNPELRNPDNFAIQFLGPRERALLSDYPMNALDLGYEAAMQQLGDKLPVKSHAFRTKAFDDAMLDALKAGARQVVVLGAGFDSRGYRFQSQLTGIRFIEVDQAATQDYKRRRVAEILGTPPANVAYVPMDFTKDNLLDQLRKGGYSEQQQTFFLWEGVVFYLPESAVKETLHFVRDHAAPGSRLAFNYTFSTDRNVNNPDSLYSKWGEPWLFGFPPPGAAPYVQREGLDVISDVQTVQNICIARVRQ